VAGAWILQGLERVNLGWKDRLVKTIAAAQVALYRRTGGRWFFDRPGAPALLLTTAGRKSGQPRTTALYYLPDGDRQVLVASYVGDARNPQWYLNLVAQPKAIAQIGSTVRDVVARLLTGDERAAIWPRLVENWPGYAGYQQRTSRELPVVALEPPETD
jgi:deazaflavin-dependent oxidoreductase (nitroreductase family)